MKILLTGASGFIASHVSDTLLKRGDQVIAIDCFNDYYDPQSKRSNIRQAKTNKNYTLCETDILNKKKLDDIFNTTQPDKVIHLAARAGVRPSLIDPQLYADVNIKGTINMLEASKDHSIKNFIFGSSSSVYGKNTKVPFSETDPVDDPISPYAATKRAGELICRTYHNLYNLNISCLRFFTVYGPRGRPDMAPYKFTKSIIEGKEITMYGDGTTKRDYTYVDDIVSGILAALDRNHPFEIFNLGNSKTVELKDFISTIETILKKKAKIKKMPIQPGDVTITYADLEKSRRLLDYDPKTSIAQGMKHFIDWYRKERAN